MDSPQVSRPNYPRWRDFVDVTPALKLLPRPPDEQEALFAEDIEANGVNTPIVVAKRNGRIVLVDGLRRVLAADQNGPVVDQNGSILVPHEWLPEDQDPEEAAIRLNGLRRDLSRRQRQELVSAILKLHSDWGDSRIAELVGGGIDHKTIGKARQRLEATGEIPQLNKTIGRDGKQRRRRPRIKDPIVAARCGFCGGEYDIASLAGSRNGKTRLCTGCAVSELRTKFQLARKVGAGRLVIIPPPLKPRETNLPEELREVDQSVDPENDTFVIVAESEAALRPLRDLYANVGRDLKKIQDWIDNVEDRTDDPEELRRLLSNLENGYGFIGDVLGIDEAFGEPENAPPLD